MRLRRALAALGVAFAWAFAAQAYDYNGVTVTAENGSIREIGDELLVTFNQVGPGKLTLDGYALARVMVVGGGGSGSTGRRSTSGTELDYRGNGGSGGEAIEYDNRYLAAGAYEVTVGAGGAAVAPNSGSNRTAGNSGSQSSFARIVAKGGAGGVVETGSQNGTGSNTVKGWGSNLKTDISGETLTYSEGGAASTNATKAGAMGADRGCGGDGGGRTNYKSGAGGKGIVIVRIKAASANPPATASFDQFVQYAEGVAVSPFDSIPDWAATITGTTNSTQRGHFSFTVSLKDGYVWSDTFGREDRTFKWAVVDDPSMGDTYLDVTKTVRADPSNPSNATISIIGHVPSEKVAVNVLFMGTMCYAHSLRPTTIQAAINSIAKRASVDWYLFHSKDVLKAKTGKLRDYETDVCSQIADTMIHTNLSGSVAKGGVTDDNFVRNELDRQMQSNNHQALNSFMELLYEVSQDPARSKRYDYIVLEFDGSRVADGYTAYEHEAEVAAFLKPYYDAKKVIWLVDNCAAGNLEPFGPMGTNERKNKYYCPCTYFHNGNSHQLYEDFQYRGLIAFTDPDHYKSDGTRATLCTSSFKWKPPKDAKTYEQYREDHGEGKTTQTVYANDAYDIQIPYDDADRVSDYLTQTIQEKPYDLEFIDKIVDSGLEITAAHLSTSNVERAAADLNWSAVTDPSVVSIDINQAAHKVNAVVSNMCSEVWAKLDIDVRDTGSFRTGVEPVSDPEGRLVATKDPNDGNGFVFKYDPGDDEPTAQGESPTLEPWKYNVYVVTGLVVNGMLKIDGIETNEAFKAEGYDCHVTYKPNAGYELDSISVDGEKLTDAELEEFSDAYDFKNIDKDHEIVVVYKQSIQQMGIEAFDAEKFYDAEPTNITWAVTNAQGGVISDAAIFLREKNTDTWIPVADFVPYVDTTNVTVEVKAEKTGFDPVTAEATVLVKPRPVTLVAASDSKVYDGLPLTTNGFTVATDTTTPGYGFVPGEGVASVTMTAASAITDPGSVDNVIATEIVKPGTKLERNYVVSTEKGTLTVTPAAFTASAEPVEKFYDAAPTNIIVTVAGIPAGVTPTYEYSYSETEGFVPAADFTGPTNVLETAEVWCRVIIPGTTNVVSAVATIKPRIVVSHAKDGEWTFNGQEHAQPDSFEDEDAEAERSKAKWGTDEVLPGSTGFVDGEGYAADLVMTDESRITNPGTKPNVIDTAADKTALKPNTKAGNYEFHYLDGTLTVTPATFTASAEPVEKFYDAAPTNIIVTVAGIPSGVTPTYEYSYSGTEGFVPAADFTGPTNVLETAEVWCRVIIPGTTNVVSATATIKPRIVVSHAKDGEWAFNGQEHAQPDSFEDEDAEAEKSKAKWGTDEVLPGSTGFVDGEGYAADLVMTDESRITNPGTKPNVIDTAADKTALKPNTKAENYELYYLNGTLTVTPASFTASATPYDEFYDGQEHTIEVEVQKPEEAGEATITYSYEEGGTYLPIEDFEQLKDVTAGGPVTVYAKVEIEGYATVVVSSTVNIKPRIVVEQADSASKIFDGTPLVQPNHHEDPDAEAEKSKAKWGTTEVLANSTGFVAGEGFADVPMTADSTITEPGVEDNVIDAAAVTLKENTKAGNYIFHYLPGELAVIQRQEEVRRDPEIVIPEEAKEVIEEADRKVNEVLGEMAKADQAATGKPYVKYQLTVTPTNHLDGTTRTTPEKAAEDAKKQIELAESVTGSKIDKAEFVDIVLERTYSKEEAESTAAGDYHKDNWDPLDKAGEHGNTLFEVVIPVEVPEGMELAGVTRSCDNRGTEILKPKDPNDPNAEGFVHDPETKTVTLYAKDFCVFGFLMKEKSSCPCISCAYVYRVKLAGKTVKGRLLAGKTSCDATTCWAKPASLRIAGYVYGSGDETGCACDPCSCNKWTAGEAMCHYWDADKRQVFADVTTFSFDLFEVLRNNGARNKAQVFWRLGGLQLAGFGTFNPDTQTLKNANGFFAGDLGPAMCADKCDKDKSKAAQVFDPCDMKTSRDSEHAIAYGRWNMSYKSDKVRAAEKSGSWSCLYPSGWQPAAE